MSGMFGEVLSMLAEDDSFRWDLYTAKDSPPKLTEVNERETILKASSGSIHRGTLNMRIGPMFSGKTTWLNCELTRFADQGFSVAKIIYSDDNRPDVASNDPSGSTHNSSYKTLTDKIVVIRTKELLSIDVSSFHVIGVDEAQFFPDLIAFTEKCVEHKGKHLRVSGLDGDFSKRKFGDVLDIIPMADEVIKLNASCKLCLAELEEAGFHGNILHITGPFTKRLIESTEQKLIGGASMYIPVCRYHHQ